MCFLAEGLQIGTAQLLNKLGTGYLYVFTRGKTVFELTNHTGNVMVTISDKKRQHTSNNTTVDYYNANVVSANAYSAFGAVANTFGVNTTNGYNVKRKNIEVNGDFYDYAFRNYDADAGRFWGVDPLTTKYPFYTPYSFAGNSPVVSLDIDGKEPTYPLNLSEWCKLADYGYNKDYGSGTSNRRSGTWDIATLMKIGNYYRLNFSVRFKMDNFNTHAEEGAVNLSDNKYGWYDCVTSLMGATEILLNNYKLANGFHPPKKFVSIY